ncbi:polysaccharide deacetylase [Arthrobacter sp. D2]|nr:polysaccharide deacetylase [Arthrobacter sp. M5]NKR16465.1 polysaccharide deacetylase [Arthrobacter sp. M6]OEH61454.1 polysaccharide deacetylase [Arthrobacter sp. D4]OEH64439.1 polysaccharide deacetylase [Arthrobacter sp. D2]
MRQCGSRPTRRAVLLTILATAAALPGRQSRLPQTTASGAPPESPPVQPAPPAQTASPKTPPPSRTDVINAFGGRNPHYWGLEAPGALTRLDPGTPGIAVTVDFCGGPGGNDIDQALLTALRERHVPATLFLNSRWLAANPATARQLAADPLFELANHGTSHRPLSITGKSAYGIPGTQDAGEVYDEVMTNDVTLTQLTGARPRFFRSGTAYLDDVAAQIVGVLGLTPAGFSINADGGATYSATTVAREAAKARPGDIIICHGNHPRGGTAEGMARALDSLAARGTPFIRLP